MCYESLISKSLSSSVLLQLFLGDTNRTISETPMNMASSRSHCIFTLNIESRKVQHSCAIVLHLMQTTFSVISLYCFIAKDKLCHSQTRMSDGMKLSLISFQYLTDFSTAIVDRQGRML